jgi:hypothetical protein
MKAQLLTVCALALVLALAGVDAHKREPKPAHWLNMTVDTVAHDNVNPSEVHLAEVAEVFTFCVPIAHRPYGEKYVATMTFFVDGDTDLFAVDFGFSEETVDYLQKDAVVDGKVTIFLHNYDGEDFFGWDNKISKDISGVVYAKGATVPRVKFGGLAIWDSASDLTCAKFEHTTEPVDDEPEQEIPADLDTNNVYINIDVNPLQYTGLSPKTLRICMFLFAGFIASMVFICCCCHINTHMEEYDELSRMEEQLQMNDTAYAHPVAEDDEAVIRRVQEESLREYNMRQQQQAVPQYHPEQQQYMRVPVMSPELYAQYLRAAQAQQQM